MPSSSSATGATSEGGSAARSEGAVGDNPFRSSWLGGGRDERLRPPGTGSYVTGKTDEPLRFLTIGQQLDKTVSRHGGREAAVFVAENLRLSWHDVKRRADEVAAGLLALGLRRG